MTYTFVVLVLAVGVWYEAPAAPTWATCEQQRIERERPIEMPGELYDNRDPIATSLCYAINRPALTQWQREK